MMKKIIVFIIACLISFSCLADVVNSINVKGNKRLEKKTVISYLPFKIGDDISSSDINQAIKDLYKTGFFDDVTVDWAEEGVLSVVFKERPIISSITIEGNKKIKTDVLEKEIQVKVRDIYVPTKVQADVDRLEMIYQRMGLLNASIVADVKNKNQNRIDLIFKIKEGQKKYIEDIFFEGNNAFSASTLREQMMSRTHRWYHIFASTDTYDPDRLNYDKDLLRRYYYQKGYIDFEVSDVKVTEDKKEDTFTILIKLNEGKRYKVGKLDISTHLTDLNMDKLKKNIELQTGKYYESGLMDQTIQQLVDELGREGYAFGEVEPVMDKKSGTVDITFKLKEGARVFVNKIDILGNSRTLDKVIRREFRLSEGDPFNTDKLRRSRQRIENLGYFDKVDLKTVPVANAPDKTDLAVTVSEKSTGAFNIGVGWSTYDGLMFEVGIQERNFLGTGKIIGVTASTSDSETQVDISLTNPYFLDMPLSAGIDTYHTIHDNTDYSSFKSKSTGGAVRFSWDYTERLRQRVKYSLQRDKMTDVESDASLYVKKQQGTYWTSMIGEELIYDKRDSAINPTSGYIASWGVDFAGLGADTKFIRTKLNATQYFELMDKWVLSFNASAGIIQGIGQDVRINNAFFLGGHNLRGFESYGAGARDKASDDALGGNWIVTGTVQLMFPLGLPEEFGLRGKLFIDAGALGKPDDIDNWDDVWYSNKIRASYGFGLLWRSPMGPINLDFGFPFMKEDYDKKEVFRLNFGTGF